MRRALALGAALWMVSSAPVFAATADQAFKDVPASCWAANAVMQMAVKRSLMNVYPDDTFRGNQPFTRAQFADSLSALVDELETMSKASWKDGAPYHWALADVPASNPDHDKIFKMVNDYHLWRNVPTVDPDHFHPDQTVTREEVAKVVSNLLSTGEAQKAVMPRDPRAPQNPFKDLTPAQWAYKAILTDNSRYRVMIGFPDVTFRPDTELTRYQYAAIGAQTFGMIRELVQQTQEENQNLTTLSGLQLFQGTTPLYIGVLGSSNALTGSTANVEVRPVFYPGDGFIFGDAQVGASSNIANEMALTVGGWFQRYSVGSWQTEPYIGVRAMKTPAGTNGGGLVGGLFYTHIAPKVGLAFIPEVNLMTTYGFGGGLDVDLSYDFTPSLSLHLSPSVLGSTSGPAGQPTFGGGGSLGLSFAL